MPEQSQAVLVILACCPPSSLALCMVTRSALLRTPPRASRRPALSSTRLEEPLPPQLGRISLDRTAAGTLIATIHASSVDAMGAAFAVAWFAALSTAPPTSAGSALFMVPFWLAGGAVLKTSVVDPRLETTLTLGEFGWTLRDELKGPFGRIQMRAADGPTATLRAAAVEWSKARSDHRNGVASTCVLMLRDGAGGAWPVATGGGRADPTALKELAREINRELARQRDGDQHLQGAFRETRSIK